MNMNTSSKDHRNPDSPSTSQHNTKNLQSKTRNSIKAQFNIKIYEGKSCSNINSLPRTSNPIQSNSNPSTRSPSHATTTTKDLTSIEEEKSLDQKDDFQEGRQSKLETDLQDIRHKLHTLKYNAPETFGPFSVRRSFGLLQNQSTGVSCKNTEQNVKKLPEGLEGKENRVPNQQEAPEESKGVDHKKGNFGKKAEQSQHSEHHLSASEQEEYNLMLRRKFNFTGDIVFLEKIGSGGFGEVQRVFDKTNRQFYARKEIKNENGVFNDRAARQEYKALRHLSELDSSSLLRVIQISYKKGESFFALMEYGQGTLNDFLEFTISQMPTVRWEDEDILELYYQILFQINELKKNNICHRDIKPDNIIISTDGFFLLADYGLAQILEKDGVQEMTTCGTRGYIVKAIQKAFSEGQHTCMIDPYEADIYALEQTIHYVMVKLNRKPDTIADLRDKYPDYVMKRRIDLYERVKKAYKVYLFDKLYTEVSLDEKYQKLRVFIGYCDFGEIREWAVKKMETLKLDEAPQFYFLLGEIYRKCAHYFDALESYKKSKSITPESHLMQHVRVNLAIASAATEVCVTSTARECLQENLEIKRKLGIDDAADVAEEDHRLARIDVIEGNVKQALEYYQKVLDLKNSKIDKYDKTLTINYEIGITFRGLRRYEDALYYLNLDKDTSKETFGSKHHSVGLTLNSLGMTYTKMNRTKEALDCLLEALDISKKVYPEDSPHIGYNLSNIAATYSIRKEKTKALEYYEKAIMIFKKSKNNDPYIFSPMSNSAEIYIELLQYGKAEEYLQYCLKEYEEASLEKRCSFGIAWIRFEEYLEEGDQNKEEPLSKRVESFKKNMEKHPGFMLFKLQLGLIKVIKKEYKEASDMILEVLDNIENVQLFILLRSVHWLFRIGQEYFQQEMLEDARDCFSLTLEIVGLAEKQVSQDQNVIKQTKNYLDIIKDCKKEEL